MQEGCNSLQLEHGAALLHSLDEIIFFDMKGSLPIITFCNFSLIASIEV